MNNQSKLSKLQKNILKATLSMHWHEAYVKGEAGCCLTVQGTAIARKLVPAFLTGPSEQEKKVMRQRGREEREGRAMRFRPLTQAMDKATGNNQMSIPIRPKPKAPPRIVTVQYFSVTTQTPVRTI
jgi:hypothetical protein